MINTDELAICRRRGHDLGPEGGLTLAKDWRRCRWCGMWARERRLPEEREDDPPADDMDTYEKIRRL